MAFGCVRNFFATVGCLVVLIAAAVVWWQFGDQIRGAYRSIVAPHAAGLSTADSTVGTPSVEALRTAERKEDEIGRSGGPRRVTLTADELASLIEDRLAPSAQRATDSLRVVLRPDRVVLQGRVRMDVFSREALGPLAELLGSSQRLRVAGPVGLRAPGRATWECDEFVIASFPFPSSVIPRLVNALTGGRDGAFVFAVPETVGAVRVEADGVTLERRAD